MLCHRSAAIAARILSFTLVLLAPAAAIAEDRIVMKNGDVITGNIAQVADDEVLIEPSYADEFAVDLAEVASIELDEAFEVELADETTLDARLALDDSGRQVLITEDGLERPIALTDLAEAVEPDPYRDWGLKADFNATYNSGNTDSKNTLLFIDGFYKQGDHRHRADLSFRNESINDQQTQEQTLFNYGYNWVFADPWFLGASFQFERDPIRELDYRYTAGLLLGRDIFDDADKYLGIALGGGWSEQELGGIVESGTTGLWNLRYEHSLLSWMDFFHTQTFTWQFYGNENSIYKTNTGLTFDLIEDLYFNVSFRYDYETEPAEGRSEDDSTLAFGLGYSF